MLSSSSSSSSSSAPPPASASTSASAPQPQPRYGRIAAFASLGYRLSPHPEFPQDPAETPARRLRTAAHPDHLNDVRAALAYLQRRYPESSLGGGNYVLVGHSAGACLALQLLHGGASGNPNPLTSPGSDLGPNPGPPLDSDVTVPVAVAVAVASPVPVQLPRAIVGFEGVYDFTGLNARMGGGYAGFLSGAFGDPSGWDAAAPMKLPGSYGERWGRGRGKPVAALGWSREDDLIDEPEIDGMAARLAGDGVDTRVFKDLRGGHDEIWQQHGEGIARMVFAVLDAVRDAGADAGAE